MTTSKKVTKIRLKKGDAVVVRCGKYKGKLGKVLATHPTQNKVTVEGINIVKKHLKPSKAHPQGDIVEITKPIWVSKVSVYDSVSKKAKRISYKFDKDGNKKRIMAGSKKEIK